MNSSSSPDYDHQNTVYIETVAKLCNDRGNSAVLRRWWSTTTRYQALPVLGRLGAIDNWAKSTTAALYAIHPHHQIKGCGIGQAALKLGTREKDSHPYERSFRRLLAANTTEDLADQLHRLIKRLERENVALDYANLFKQLRLWQAGYQQSIRVRWAKEFWQAPLTPPVS